MAQEIKIKGWRATRGSIVIPLENIPPLLQEKVNKLHFFEEFTLTLSVPDPRGDWIEKWYKKAKEAGDAIFRHHKTVTICYDKYGYGPVTLSDVRKGDIYDRKTGIAVAYAKYCGEPIPKFI